MTVPAIARAQSVRFGPSGASIEADLYLPAGHARRGSAATVPIVVMAHGLGAVRAMGLAAPAERFAEAGYACLVFDYRHFGGSDGLPRHLLSVRRQRADWRAALTFARGIPGVDPDRIVAWGTSFGGGHVLATAARRPPGLVAVIAQNPFTHGLRSALAMHPASSIAVTAAAVRDLVGSWRGRPPHRIPTAGATASAALMTAPDAEPGYLALVPADSDFRNEVAARAVFDILRDRPGRHVPRITVPTLFCLCDNDSVAPADAALTYAARSPRAEIRTYPVGHFAIYSGRAFERAIADQLDFLRRHVPVVTESAGCRS